MSDRAFGVDHPPKSARGLAYFDVEVNDGTQWVSLNDQFRYRLTAKSLDRVTQSRRRKTVTSAMYDGEWEVHSTLGNAEETLEVDIFGASQSEISVNQQRLIAAFSQSVYNVRVSMDEDVQTWRCFPAEYSISRGQINAHNRRATLTLSVPRFPKITYEVRA